MDRRERMNDPEEMLRAANAGLNAALWTALPCIVQYFDPAKLTLVAQPCIQSRKVDETGKVTLFKMPLLVDVPVVFPSGGGFILTFPVQANDECLVVFSSRCIDAWHQQGGVQPPAELRMHHLSDGFAIVGPKSIPRVPADISSTKVTLRSDDGETFIELSNGLIRLVADAIKIEARDKANIGANGTGVSYQDNHVDTYLNGVPTDDHSPSPPQIP